ncbi:MAG TPA: hypothetical protein HPQ04_13170 [Rhodospirillaceae bacterium]|nr:hypothetical protein [Rhodospirillaceae bacterium]
MDLNFKIDVEQLKALPLHLKIVGGVILADLLVVLVCWLLFDDMLSERVAVVDGLRGQVAQLRRQSADFRKQIDQYPQLLVQYNDAVAKGILTEVDRLKLVNEAQDTATRNHLPDLHFKVESEPLIRESGPRFRFDSTLVTFESTALLDTQVMAFWDEVLNRLPAHYQVVEAKLERKKDVDAAAIGEIRAGRPVSLVGMKLSFRIQALRSAQQEGQ